MTGTLESPRHHELHEVSEMQAWRSGVETDIERDRPSGKMLGKCSLIGGERHQATPFQLAEHVDHGCSLPRSTPFSESASSAASSLPHLG